MQVGHWRGAVPSRTDLLRTSFGQPDLSHSFIQTPCMDATHVLRSGFLAPAELLSFMTAHPLLSHLAASLVAFSNYDFRWIREYNQDWNKQTSIDPIRQCALTAALLHFNLDVSMLMRYLGNNYTGAHRDVQAGPPALQQITNISFFLFLFLFL